MQVAQTLHAQCSRIETDYQRGGRSLVQDTCNDEQIILLSSPVVRDGVSREWYMMVSVIPSMGTNPVCPYFAVQVAAFSTYQSADGSVIVDSDDESNSLGLMVIRAFDQAK